MKFVSRTEHKIPQYADDLSYFSVSSFSSLNSHEIEFSADLDKLTSLNYDHQIPKVFSLIEQLKRGILTPKVALLL